MGARKLNCWSHLATTWMQIGAHVECGFYRAPSQCHRALALTERGLFEDIGSPQRHGSPRAPLRSAPSQGSNLRTTPALTFSRWICWISRPLDLLDFGLFSIQIAPKSSLACWIFVGFRDALNVCSHRQKLQNRALTRPSMSVKRRQRAGSIPPPSDGRRGSRGGA
jgi:hypothetical protein